MRQPKYSFNLHSQRTFRNVFINSTSVENKSYVTMNLTIEQNPSRFTMFVNIKQKLPSFFFSVNLDLITTRGKVYPSFFYRQTNMCEFFTKPITDIIFSMVYNELSKSGEFINRCPIQKVRMWMNTDKLSLKFVFCREFILQEIFHQPPTDCLLTHQK